MDFDFKFAPILKFEILEGFNDDLVHLNSHENFVNFNDMIDNSLDNQDHKTLSHEDLIMNEFVNNDGYHNFAKIDTSSIDFDFNEIYNESLDEFVDNDVYHDLISKKPTQNLLINLMTIIFFFLKEEFMSIIDDNCQLDHDKFLLEIHEYNQIYSPLNDLTFNYITFEFHDPLVDYIFTKKHH